MSRIDLRRALAIEGWMEPDELAWLATEAQQADHILEVGSFKGRSTRALGDHARGSVLVVDHWLPPSERSDLAADEFYRVGPEAVWQDWQRNLADLVEAGKVTVLRSHSTAAAAQLLREGAEPVDLCFLDAEHSFIGVLMDILAYERLVRPGGILAGHDYTTAAHPGVRRAVDHRFGERVQHGAGSIWWVRL